MFAEPLKKCQWLDMLEVKAQRALVQSHFLNGNQLDAPTKYFFSLEKKNGRNRFLHALRSEARILLFDQTDIRKRAVEFYKGLYRSEASGECSTDSGFFENLSQLTEEVL